MTTGNPDIEILASDPKPLTLESGFEIVVSRLRTRALMSLMRILTVGAGEAIATIRLDADVTEEAFTGQLVAATLLAIPEAENETIEFINRMVEPAGIVVRTRTKADVQHNLELQEELREQLQDPELDDLFTIVEQIIRTEAPHMLALGKRLAALIQTMRKSQTPLVEQNNAKKPAASSKSGSKVSTRTGS